MMEGLLPDPLLTPLLTRMTLIRRKGSQSVRKPVSLSDSTRRPQLTALGILWNDVCERYARSKGFSGGELQVS